MLERGVGGQDRVVGLNNRRRHLGRRVDGKLKLALLAIVGRQTLHHEGTKARAGSTTERVEDHEALETLALVRKLADAIHDLQKERNVSELNRYIVLGFFLHLVNKLLADGVVATGIVVGSILLAADELLGVEELLVGAVADLRGVFYFKKKIK